MAKEEAKIQKKITDHLKRDGWFVTKLMQTSTNGIPDVLAVKCEQCLFIEVKTEIGKLSKLQEFLIKQLRDKYSQDIIVAYGYEDFKTKYTGK